MLEYVIPVHMSSKRTCSVYLAESLVLKSMGKRQSQIDNVVSLTILTIKILKLAYTEVLLMKQSKMNGMTI